MRRRVIGESRCRNKETELICIHLAYVQYRKIKMVTAGEGGNENGMEYTEMATISTFFKSWTTKLIE